MWAGDAISRPAMAFEPGCVVSQQKEKLVMEGNDINNTAPTDDLRLAASAEARAEQIRSEKIATLYRQSPGILVGAWTATFIVTFFLWDAVPPSRIIPWLLTAIFVNTWLALLWWFNWRSPPERQATPMCTAGQI